MNKYKITYWLNSNIKVTHVEAKSKDEALIIFYLNNRCDDVIEVSNV